MESNVFNESWKLRWNFSLKTFDFRHSAHLCHSRGTLVCHGTQVGKHCQVETSVLWSAREPMTAGHCGSAKVDPYSKITDCTQRDRLYPIHCWRPHIAWQRFLFRAIVQIKNDSDLLRLLSQICPCMKVLCCSLWYHKYYANRQYKHTCHFTQC